MPGALNERIKSWKVAARANERRWMLAKDLEWIIATTTTEAELIREVERRIHGEVPDARRP